MKVHLQKTSQVGAGYSRQARDVWERDGLIPGVEKACDQLMVSEQRQLTTVPDEVTCLRCRRLLTKE